MSGPLEEAKPDTRCTVRCDKGSRCTKEKHSDEYHETEHGCVCIGPETSAKYSDAVEHGRNHGDPSD